MPSSKEAGSSTWLSAMRAVADPRWSKLDRTGAATTGRPSRSDVIELHVAELQQLFDVLDPRPCPERALDARAHEFIVERSRALPRHAPLSLLVHLDRSAGLPNEQAVLRDTVHGYFRERSDASRRRLRQLLRVGRISLVIGLAFLAMAVAASQILERSTYDAAIAVVFRETILIGGWVAMWRPLEIFLYDWWPIRAEARRFDRLAEMPVRINYESGEPSNAWQRDWPAAQHVHTRGIRS